MTFMKVPIFYVLSLCLSVYANNKSREATKIEGDTSLRAVNAQITNEDELKIV